LTTPKRLGLLQALLHYYYYLGAEGISSSAASWTLFAEMSFVGLASFSGGSFLPICRKRFDTSGGGDTDP